MREHVIDQRERFEAAVVVVVGRSDHVGCVLWKESGGRPARTAYAAGAHRQRSRDEADVQDVLVARLETEGLRWQGQLGGVHVSRVAGRAFDLTHVVGSEAKGS